MKNLISIQTERLVCLLLTISMCSCDRNPEVNSDRQELPNLTTNEIQLPIGIRERLATASVTQSGLIFSNQLFLTNVSLNVAAVNATFFGNNQTSQSIEVSGIFSDCNCAIVTREVPFKIAPGTREGVTVSIDTSKKSGATTNLISIITREGTEEYVQWLTNVVNIPSIVNFDPNQIVLERGDDSSESIRITNLLDYPIEIIDVTMVQENGRGLLGIDWTIQEINQGQEYLLLVRADDRIEPGAKFEFYIALTQYEYAISKNAIIKGEVN